jgi:hypothetical protein
MIRLYGGSGSQEIEILGDAMPVEDWARLRTAVCQLLHARNHSRSAQLLEDIPFELRDGTNSFRDEFSVLYWSAALDRYVEAATWYEDRTYRNAFDQIARTVSEVGPYIRFIAVDLDTNESPTAVKTPSLQVTSDIVERALREAERLLQSSGATSGLDRVHTAFHGYLKAACDKYSISISGDPSIVALFKILREQVPKLSSAADQRVDIERIVKALAVVVDTLNPLRNRGSMAHPNENLLGEPESMLAINAIRTLLHYFDAKLAG